MDTKAVFVGITNIKTRYQGDGIKCDVSSPKTCKIDVPEAKAIQLMVDHPDEWEFPTVKNRKKFMKDYQNRMIAEAENAKGIKVVYSDGKEEHYPSDSKIDVVKPKK